MAYYKLYVAFISNKNYDAMAEKGTYKCARLSTLSINIHALDVFEVTSLT